MISDKYFQISNIKNKKYLTSKIVETQETHNTRKMENINDTCRTEAAVRRCFSK